MSNNTKDAIYGILGGIMLFAIGNIPEFESFRMPNEIRQTSERIQAKVYGKLNPVSYDETQVLLQGAYYKIHRDEQGYYLQLGGVTEYIDLEKIKK